MDNEQLHLRRQERRRELARRRRRLLAVAGLLLGLVLIVAAVVLTRSGGHTSTNASSPTQGVPATQQHPGGSRSTAAGTVDPSARATGRPGTAPVPILMYHVIAAPPPGAKFPGLYVPPQEFAAQMRALAAAGWHAVTLDQMQAYWTHGVALPPGHPIVVTFDNGYRSQYTQALPVLQALGWPGDLNMQLVGLPISQGGLSNAQIRGLVAAGWELDTQGFSHADLVALSAAGLQHEVADARAVVRQRFHVPVRWFCYPSGHFNAAVIAAVRAAGYVGSTTVVPGWARPGQDPYRLERIRVLGGTSARGLLSLISGVRANGPPPASYAGAGTA